MERCGCSSMPKCCKKRCVGIYTNTYKMYETCCYDMVKVCSCCGHEYDHNRYPVCPHCGVQMDDPPRGFGGFGRGRFGGFSPDFEEEEEEEFF